MARIRTIKPEFFKHEDLFDAEKETGLPLRLAFAGIWTVCDRKGRFEWRPRSMKTDVLPYDDVDFSRVLDALATRGFVVRYRVAGKDYGYVPGFSRHQVINNRESDSKLPAPPQDIDIDKDLTPAPRVNDASLTRHDLAQAEGEGEGERNIGGGGSAQARETLPPDPTWREQLLDAMGVDPSGLIGPNGKVIGQRIDLDLSERWQRDLGLTCDAILTVIRETMAHKRDGPPSSFKYFTKAMQREAARSAECPLQPTPADEVNHDRPNARDRREAAAADRLGRILDAAARTN